VNQMLERLLLTLADFLFDAGFERLSLWIVSLFLKEGPKVVWCDTEAANELGVNVNSLEPTSDVIN
jgi:hypothetical protein